MDSIKIIDGGIMIIIPNGRVVPVRTSLLPRFSVRATG
jgi:hypothetical protein